MTRLAMPGVSVTDGSQCHMTGTVTSHMVQSSLPRIKQPPRRRKRAFVPMVLVLLALLVGCEPGDSTVIRGANTTMACWYDICPGKTTRQETLNALAKVPEVDVGSIQQVQLGDEGSYLHWAFGGDVIERNGYIYYQGDAVNRIEINTGEPLTVAKLVETFGPPEHVLATSGCADTRWLWHGLFWPDLGVRAATFDFHFRSSEVSAVQPDQDIVEIEYFAPDALEQTLASSEGVPTDRQGEVRTYLQAWNGYGTVKYWDLCR